jgi:hypothetical protein
MPLLPPEPFVFPDNLFATAGAAPDETRRWWVLHTRPRAEKVLARSLMLRDLPFFLPIYHRRWRSSGRARNAYLPLFPGYLFLLGDSEASVEALQTKQVARCIRVEDQAQIYADLLRVHQLVTRGNLLTPEESMQPGTLVEIIDGPLTGLQGKILRRGRKLKFMVEVHFIQRGASVEVDASMIRQLDGSS